EASTSLTAETFPPSEGTAGNEALRRKEMKLRPPSKLRFGQSMPATRMHFSPSSPRTFQGFRSARSQFLYGSDLWQFREFVKELPKAMRMESAMQDRAHRAFRGGFGNVQPAAGVKVLHDHGDLNAGLATVRFKDQFHL